MSKFYLIKDKKSGLYFKTNREFTKNIKLAKKYKTKKMAENLISNTYMSLAKNQYKIIEYTDDCLNIIEKLEKLLNSKNLEIRVREVYQSASTRERCKLVNELEIYRKALNLACFDIYGLSQWENSQEEVIEDSIKFYKNKAKEIIEANNQLKIIEKEQLKDE